MLLEEFTVIVPTILGETGAISTRVFENHASDGFNVVSRSVEVSSECRPENGVELCPVKGINLMLQVLHHDVRQHTVDVTRKTTPPKVLRDAREGVPYIGLLAGYYAEVCAPLGRRVLLDHTLRQLMHFCFALAMTSLYCVTATSGSLD